MLRERATTCIGQEPIDQFVSAVASDLVLKSTKNTKLVGRLSLRLHKGKTHGIGLDNGGYNLDGVIPPYELFSVFFLE